METNLFQDLHALLHLKISGGKEAIECLMKSLIEFSGYEFIQDVEEGSTVDFYVCKNDGDISAAFFDHMQGLPAYLTYCVFASICEKYLIKREVFSSRKLFQKLLHNG